MYIYNVYIYNACIYIYTYISIPMYRSVLMNMCMQAYNTSMNMNVSSRGCAAAGTNLSGQLASCVFGVRHM